MQLAAAQTRAPGAEYEIERAKARLRQLQSGQQRYQIAVSRVQNEIAALGAALVKNSNYLQILLEHSNDHIFSGLVRKLVKEGCQAKMNVYKDSKQMVIV